jgi:RNA polymerase sigma factor (sigma-70 family)
MPLCASCSKRSACPEICPSVERFLRQGDDTSYQKEQTVPPKILEHLAFKAWQKDLLRVNDKGHRSKPEQDPLLRKAQEAIQTLTPKQDQVYYLYHIEGWTHMKIAEERGTSRQNISTSWSRIRKRVARYCSK